MKNIFLLISLCLSQLGVMFTSPAFAAMNAQLTLVGTKQGPMEGDGPKGVIRVLSFNDGLTRPSDPGSGMPTGRISRTPFVIIKELDKASTKIIEALVNGEVLKSFVLKLFKTAPDGKELNFFSISLTDATLLGRTEASTGNNLPTEDLSFSYRKITWTDEITHQSVTLDVARPLENNLALEARDTLFNFEAP